MTPFLFIFSKAYEEAESKSHLVLLKYKARIILEYEALGIFDKSDAKYIYYISEKQDFERWYKRKDDDQVAIYKDPEEESTFTKHTFKKSDYDEASIWKFDNQNES